MTQHAPPHVPPSSGEPVTRLFLLLIGANLTAWVWAWTEFSDHPALLGASLLAWVFGLRHAVDADHIAAIDNVTRKLMRDGGQAVRVGLFFSLGHATVVVMAALAAAGVAGALQSQLAGLRDIAGPIGSAISALFLLVIALANLVILLGAWRCFRRVRAGETLAEEDVIALPGGMPFGGGLLARLLRPALRAVTRSWHMYPLGFLFGLGFDTATEIGLLGIAATEAAQGLPAWRTLVFPALFTAGMALVDTADSVLMVRAYGWALVHPLRKLWYNVTITAASVIVALLIGGIETLGLIARSFALDGMLWRGVAALNDRLADVGLAMIGIFVFCWAVSALIYRWKGYDARVQGT